jgi:hypothetical protein
MVSKNIELVSNAKSRCIEIKTLKELAPTASDIAGVRLIYILFQSSFGLM